MSRAILWDKAARLFTYGVEYCIFKSSQRRAIDTKNAYELKWAKYKPIMEYRSLSPRDGIIRVRDLERANFSPAVDGPWS